MWEAMESSRSHPLPAGESEEILQPLQKIVRIRAGHHRPPRFFSPFFWSARQPCLLPERPRTNKPERAATETSERGRVELPDRLSGVEAINC